MEKRQLPNFKTEDEEARWWFDHREEIAQDFLNAAKRGTLGPGAAERNRRRQAVIDGEALVGREKRA